MTTIASECWQTIIIVEDIVANPLRIHFAGNIPASPSMRAITVTSMTSIGLLDLETINLLLVRQDIEIIKV